MDKKNKVFVWFNVICIALIAVIGGYYLAPYYFEKNDLANYTSGIFFAVSLAAGLLGILVYKYSKNKSSGLVIKILFFITIIMGLSVYLAIKYYIFLIYLYLASVLLGCGLAVIFSIVLYKLDEMKGFLSYILAGLAVLTMFLEKRLIGDMGIFLGGIGIFSGIIFLLYVYNKESTDTEFVPKLFKISLLTSISFLSWGLLQICLRRLSIQDIGINLNHSYTFLGLFLGIIIPIIIKNNVLNYINLQRNAKIFIILLISLIPLLMGLIITSTAVASYMASYLFAFIIMGFLSLDDVMEIIPPFVLTYIITVFSAPLFSIFDNFKRLIRAGVFVALIIISLLFYKYLFKKYLLSQKVQ